MGIKGNREEPYTHMDISRTSVSTSEQQHDKTNKMTCAPSKDSGQPVHLPSLIRHCTVLAIHMKKSLVRSYPLSSQRRLWSDWADTQADLSLCLSHRSFCWFCYAVAHLISQHKFYRCEVFANIFVSDYWFVINYPVKQKRCFPLAFSTV